MPPQNVRIVATPNKEAHQFTINFETQSGEKALHFNARFDERAVVRNNTQPAGNWHNEERHGAFPFHHGKTFVLDFLSDQGGSVINVGAFFGLPSPYRFHRLLLLDQRRWKTFRQL
jgi:Galactoside-binding lectin